MSLMDLSEHDIVVHDRRLPTTTPCSANKYLKFLLPKTKICIIHNGWGRGKLFFKGDSSIINYLFILV